MTRAGIYQLPNSGWQPEWHSGQDAYFNFNSQEAQSKQGADDSRLPAWVHWGGEVGRHLGGVGCRQEEENTSPGRRLRLGCKISTALEFWGAKDNRPSRARIPGRELPPPNWEGLEEKHLGTNQPGRMFQLIPIQRTFTRELQRDSPGAWGVAI